MIFIFLSSNLKYLRKFFGYSQKQVAAILEVDRSTYSYYEIGKTTPSPENLIRLSELYNISIDNLLSGHVENDISQLERGGSDFVQLRSADERELLLLFRNADKQMRRKLLELCKEYSLQKNATA